MINAEQLKAGIFDAADKFDACPREHAAPPLDNTPTTLTMSTNGLRPLPIKENKAPGALVLCDEVDATSRSARV